MRLVGLILLVILTNGCSVASKTWAVWTDPSVPVGEPKDRPSMMSMSMNAGDEINPNLYNDNTRDEPPVKMVQSQSNPPDAPYDGLQILITGKSATGSTIAIAPEATPIVFKVIQLKDNSFMLQADFESLFDDLEDALNTSYLEHDDYMLVPGEYKHIEPFALEEETHYIAVIAAFNDYTNAVWKQLIKVKSKGQNIALMIDFKRREVTMKAEESYQ